MVALACRMGHTDKHRGYKMERYFIFDCLGNVRGNVKGYATYKGASMIFNRQKLQVELIDLAHLHKVEGSGRNSVLIGSIKLQKVL